MLGTSLCHLAVPLVVPVLPVSLSGWARRALLPRVVLFLAHLRADAMVKITLHGNESTDWDLNKIYIKLCLEY